MNRRRFMQFLGMATAVPLAVAKAMQANFSEWPLWERNAQKREQRKFPQAFITMQSGDQYCVSCKKWLSWSSVPITKKTFCDDCALRCHEFLLNSGNGSPQNYIDNDSFAIAEQEMKLTFRDLSGNVRMIERNY